MKTTTGLLVAAGLLAGYWAVTHIGLFSSARPSGPQAYPVGSGWGLFDAAGSAVAVVGSWGEGVIDLVEDAGSRVGDAGAWLADPAGIFSGVRKLFS